MEKQNTNDSLFSLSYLLQILLFAVIYYFAALISSTFAGLAKTASPVWIPTGLGFALIVLKGKKYWPAIFLGAFLITLRNGTPASVKIPVSIGNALEALIAYYHFHWYNDRREKFGLYTTTYAILLTSLIPTIFGAVFGGLSLTILGGIPMREFFHVFITWWIGNIMGSIVFFPLIYFFADKTRRETPIKYAVTLAISLLLFWVVIARAGGAPYLFFLFPFAFFCAVYSGETGTSLGIAALSLASLFATKYGIGIFNLGSSNANLINLQIFIGSLCLTGLFLNDFKKSSFLKSASTVLFGGWLLSGLLFATFYKQSVQISNQEFSSILEKLELSIKTKMEKM